MPTEKTEKTEKKEAKETEDVRTAARIFPRTIFRNDYYYRFSVASKSAFNFHSICALDLHIESKVAPFPCGKIMIQHDGLRWGKKYYRKRRKTREYIEVYIWRW